MNSLKRLYTNLEDTLYWRFVTNDIGGGLPERVHDELRRPGRDSAIDPLVKEEVFEEL